MGCIRQSLGRWSAGKEFWVVGVPRRLNALPSITLDLEAESMKQDSSLLPGNLMLCRAELPLASMVASASGGYAPLSGTPPTGRSVSRGQPQPIARRQASSAWLA